jgi:hypothetical protein
MTTGEDGQSILLDLAKKQDEFEHEHSSELATRIGLFLVFAGFVSGVAVELLKLIHEAGTGTTAGRLLTIAFLILSSVALFAAMVLLLWAAFLPGYSAPAAVSAYRKHYAQLLGTVKEDAGAAQSKLKESILDAMAEAVDKNIQRNHNRARALKWAQILLLASIICLFLTLLFFGLFYLRTEPKSSNETHQAAGVNSPGGISKPENKPCEDAKAGPETTKPQGPPPRHNPGNHQQPPGSTTGPGSKPSVPCPGAKF